MEFINEQVGVMYLPRMEALELQPLGPAYLRSLRLTYIITCLVVLAALSAVIFFVPAMRHPLRMVALTGGWLLLVAAGWWLELRSFRQKGFAVREKDIFYRSGWIIRQTSGCPFNRIQHCSVSSGPIDRRFGLATLRIYTAGAEGDLAIPGLPQEQAFSIKEFIMQKIVKDEQPAH